MTRDGSLELEPILVNASGVAKMLGISRGLLYEMSADGRLGPPPLHFGRRALWRVDELRAWTAANCPPRTAWLKRLEGGQANG